MPKLRVYTHIVVVFLLMVNQVCTSTIRDGTTITKTVNEDGTSTAALQGMDKIRAAVKLKAQALSEATANMWTAAMQDVAEGLFTEAVESASLANEAASERDRANQRADEAGNRESEWKRAATEALMEEERSLHVGGGVDQPGNQDVGTVASGFAETGETVMNEIKTPGEFLKRLEHLRASGRVEAGNRESEWQRAATEALLEEERSLNVGGGVDQPGNQDVGTVASGFAETGETVMNEIKTPAEFISRLKHARDKGKISTGNIEEISSFSKSKDTTNEGVENKSPSSLSDEELLAKYNLPSLFHN